MSSITKLNRYICGRNSALPLRVCPAWFDNSPHFRSSCCLWACTRSPGSWFFTERPRKPPRQLSLTPWHIRSLAGPILIYMLRYTRIYVALYPGGQADRLRRASNGRGAISARFERRCSAPLPVETHHFDQALHAGGFQFLSGLKLHRDSVADGKESRFQEITSSSSHDHL